MNAVTLDQALDTALQLQPNQQEMLINILSKRRTEIRRQEIMADANKSVAAFREGKLKMGSAEETIAELCRTIEDHE